MRKLVLLNIDDGVMNQVIQSFVEYISGGSCVSCYSVKSVVFVSNGSGLFPGVHRLSGVRSEQEVCHHSVQVPLRDGPGKAEADGVPVVLRRRLLPEVVQPRKV